MGQKAQRERTQDARLPALEYILPNVEGSNDERERDSIVHTSRVGQVYCPRLRLWVLSPTGLRCPPEAIRIRAPRKEVDIQMPSDGMVMQPFAVP